MYICMYVCVVFLNNIPPFPLSSLLYLLVYYYYYYYFTAVKYLSLTTSISVDTGIMCTWQINPKLSTIPEKLFKHTQSNNVCMFQTSPWVTWPVAADRRHFLWLCPFILNTLLFEWRKPTLRFTRTWLTTRVNPKQLCTPYISALHRLRKCTLCSALYIQQRNIWDRAYSTHNDTGKWFKRSLVKMNVHVVSVVFVSPYFTEVCSLFVFFSCFFFRGSKGSCKPTLPESKLLRNCDVFVTYTGIFSPGLSGTLADVY